MTVRILSISIRCPKCKEIAPKRVMVRWSYDDMLYHKNCMFDAIRDLMDEEMEKKDDQDPS